MTLSSCSINARIKKADRKYAIGEYYEAGEMYRQIYRRIPSKDKRLRAHVAFQQGESYRILNNSRAASAYKNAIKDALARRVADYLFKKTKREPLVVPILLEL